jgi:DNA-binding MarR family transcriptional regulator
MGADEIPLGRPVDIAEMLLRRAALLSRLILRRVHLGVSRVEIGILSAAAEKPQRITDLAAAEGVSPSTISLYVNQLVDRGWVVRENDPSDRRVALVTLSPEGHRAWVEMRTKYRALLHDTVVMLDDDAVQRLADAANALDRIIKGLMAREPSAS